MGKMEKAALQHATEWLRYQRSAQAKIDLITDRARRAAADAKAGHLPACSLTKCAKNCPSA